MGKREEYIDKLAAQLKEWNAQIDVLKERANKENAETKAKVQARIEELKKEKDQIASNLDALRAESSEAWQAMAEGITNAGKQLKEAFAKALDQFKS